jgi:hypothetical protein
MELYVGVEAGNADRLCRGSAMMRSISSGTEPTRDATDEDHLRKRGESSSISGSEKVKAVWPTPLPTHTHTRPVYLRR